MTPSMLALSIVAAIVVGTIAFALFSIRKIKMDPQQYIVGGRSFGSFLLWFLFAGEIYTSFTFLGAAGIAYGEGAPAFYILAYGTVAYTIGYFFLPPVWRIAKERKLLTWPDFLLDRYGSKTLSACSAIVQFFLVVPYVTLQLGGLQILLRIAGYGSVNATAAVAVAFLLVAFFVFTAGLRGTAWASVLKDALVLGAVVFAGIVLPIRFFGSPAGAIDRVLATHPHWFTLAPGSAFHGETWYVSTVLLSGIGFFMGAANAPAIYSARSERAIRTNMILMPLYQIVLLLVFFAGFTALAVHPGLKGTAVDQSFLLVVQRSYSPWILGAIAGTGCLAALLPASALLLGAATLVSKNVLGDVFGIGTSDRQRTLATRLLVMAVAILALVLWLTDSTTLVPLLLVYYNGITQFMPAVVFALVWPRVNAWAAGAGICGGEIVAFLFPNVNVFGLNVGFFALLVNVGVCTAVTLTLTKEKPAAVAAGSPVPPAG